MSCRCWPGDRPPDAHEHQRFSGECDPGRQGPAAIPGHRPRPVRPEDGFAAHNYTWSIAGGGVGSVNNNGQYTAPNSGTGTATVQATSGSITGTASVTVKALPPVITQPASPIRIRLPAPRPGSKSRLPTLRRQSHLHLVGHQPAGRPPLRPSITPTTITPTSPSTRPAATPSPSPSRTRSACRPPAA